MENGAVARDANSVELEQLYNGFLRRLVNSYDKLKTKFNTYAAKCLSEKQKRECGLGLIAPALVMPYERLPDEPPFSATTLQDNLSPH